MIRYLRIVAAMALLVAACGGDGDATTTTVATSGGSDTTAVTTTTTTTTAAPVASGAGSSEDFCMVLADYAATIEESSFSIAPAEIERQFRDSLAAMQQAQSIAPSEVKADVDLFVDVFGGFIDFMDDFDFNFLAMPEGADQDPRLLALDDPELEAAGDRIETYCGIEGEFITPGPDAGGTDTGAPTDPGDGNVVVGGELPEGFPVELAPPGGEVTASVSMAGAESVTFEIEGSTDDVIDYYESVVGPAMAELNEPRGALWATTYNGQTLSVVVTEVLPGMVQVNVSFT